MRGNLEIWNPECFPSYAGNGMLKSLGNVLLNPKIGLMFIDFGQPRQLRVNGLAAIDRSMRTRYLASALGIFLAAGQPRIAMSAVLEQDGLTLRIPASPTLVLRIDAAFKPLLPLRIPIAGKTSADRRIFVDADAESGIRRLVIVQYETVNPGVKFSFVYPARPPAEFGAQTYQFYAYVHDDERAAAKSPHAEAGLTRAFLVEQGFRVPRLFRLARLARVADRDGQSEVIVFYIENADADFAPGPLAGADEDGDLALDAASKQAILERLKSAVHAVSQ